jgi:hypothetical protein
MYEPAASHAYCIERRCEVTRAARKELEGHQVEVNPPTEYIRGAWAQMHVALQTTQVRQST